MDLNLNENQLETLNTRLPWYQQPRSNFLQAFKNSTYPAPNAEIWRQTPLRLFDLVKTTRPAKGSISISEFGDGGNSQLPGVQLSVNEAVSAKDVQALLEIFSKEANPDLEFISNLQKSITGTVAALTVAKNSVTAKPVLISYKAETKDGAFAPLLVVNIERGAEITLIEELGSDLPSLFMPRIEFRIGEGARLTFVSIQRMCDKAQYLGRHNFSLMKDANIELVHIGTGAGVARLDLDCNLLGEGANANMNSFFIGDKARHIDFHPTQNHFVANCRSDLYSKFVLKEQSRSVYYGYIKVAENAQKTDAYQTNRNLVLSHDAKADTVPNLEIKANDVKCSHGASVGQVSAEELFYLLSRGITREMAERLLVEGFFEDVLDRIKNAVIRDDARKIILERLDNGTNNCQA